MFQVVLMSEETEDEESQRRASSLDEEEEEEGGTGGQHVESESTVETVIPEELQNFIDKINAVNVGEGQALLDLISTLPKVNSVLGQGHTKTRILKYLQNKTLLPASLVGESNTNTLSDNNFAFIILNLLHSFVQ